MILSESLSTSRTVTAAGPCLARAGLLTLDRHTSPHTYKLQHIGMIISKYNSHLRFLFTLQSLFQHKNFMIKLIIFFPNFKLKLKRNFCSKSSQLMTFMESIHQWKKVFTITTRAPSVQWDSMLSIIPSLNGKRKRPVSFNFWCSASKLSLLWWNLRSALLWNVNFHHWFYFFRLTLCIDKQSVSLNIKRMLTLLGWTVHRTFSVIVLLYMKDKPYINLALNVI